MYFQVDIFMRDIQIGSRLVPAETEKEAALDGLIAHLHSRWLLSVIEKSPLGNNLYVISIKDDNFYGGGELNPTFCVVVRRT